MSKYFRPNMSSDELRHFSKSTAKQKLQWLEEANRFVSSLPKRIKKLHEKFRKGEI